jgi:hypothetical protein
VFVVWIRNKKTGTVWEFDDKEATQMLNRKRIDGEAEFEFVEPKTAEVDVEPEVELAPVEPEPEVRTSRSRTSRRTK